MSKIAVVSGAGSGIGAATAKLLAGQGHKVALVGRRAEKLESVVKEITDTGGTAFATPGDVGRESDVADIRKRVEEKFGPADILVNNAGVTRDGLIIRMKTEDFESVVRTNLFGAFFMTRAFAAAMLKNRWGRIVNVGSVVGLMGNAGQANYAASKGGLFGFTKACAKEFSSRTVTVNAVAPGFIETEMTAGLSDKLRDQVIAETPLGRLAKADEVAALIGFLCSEPAGYITGEIVRIDGGMAM